MKITNSNYTNMSYFKMDFLGHYSLTNFEYMDINIFGDEKRRVVEDHSIEYLLKKHLISQSQYDLYLETILKKCCSLDENHECYYEEYYNRIMKVRREIFKNTEFFAYKKEINIHHYLLNQSNKLNELQKKYKAVFLVIEKLFISTKDIKRILNLYCGHKVFVFVKSKHNEIYYSQDDLFEFKNDVDFIVDYSDDLLINYSNFDFNVDEIFVHAMGETSLLATKSLSVEAFVEGECTYYLSQVYLNKFQEKGKFAVYVPVNFDIVKSNPLVSFSTMTYDHLTHFENYFVEHLYQDDITLMKIKPSLFMNFYECKEFEMKEFGEFNSYDEFYSEKNKWLINKFKHLDKMQYERFYLDKNNNSIPLSLFNNKDGQLVDIIKIKEVKQANVFFQPQKNIVGVKDFVKRKENHYGLISNFMFFTTQNVIKYYNLCRYDRPDEQIPVEVGHLGYIKEKFETFPLYNKAALCKTNDGKFYISRMTLKGGELSINDEKIAFKESDVNPKTPKCVAIYTPMISEDDYDEKTGRLILDNDRINMVIIKDKIICIKDSVVMPSIGVVVSFDKNYAAQFNWFQQCKYSEGAYEYNDLNFKLNLNNPSELSDETWSTMDWVYGGAIQLDGLNKKSIEEGLRSEGWMKKLSIQTQESPIHNFSKHPRTAFCITKQGELAICVFSGRLIASVGVDYEQMVQIIHQCLPDVKQILNGDGGASSVMAFYTTDFFIEVSVPCMSADNPVGKIRNLNAMFTIEEKESSI